MRLDTVKKWSAGTNPVPAGAWDDLRRVEAERSEFVDEAIGRWREAGSPERIEMNTGEGADTMRLVMLILALPPATTVNFGEAEARLLKAPRRVRCVPL